MANRGHFKPGQHTSTENKPCAIEGHVQESYTLRGQVRRRCRDCNLERSRRYAKERHERRRRQAIEHYGGCCSCCGESNIVFLAIDHVNDDGSSHRKAIGASGSTTTYRWLEQNGYPEGFQVLCHNCNYAKHLLGVCPHQGGDAL